MKTLKFISERALPLLFWIMLMLAFDTPTMTFLTICAALTHEIGHIAVMSFLTKGLLSLPRAVIFGMRLRADRMLSYKEEAVLAAGGPIINLLVFFFLIPTFDNDYAYTFAVLNLLTAISNLIPINGYDGYRILSAFMSRFPNPTLSESIMSHTSLLFSVFAVFASLFFILKIGEGYWVFAVFFVILIKDIFKLQSKTNNENSGDFGRF